MSMPNVDFHVKMLALIDTRSWQASLFSFIRSAGSLALAYIATVVGIVSHFIH